MEISMTATNHAARIAADNNNKGDLKSVDQRKVALALGEIFIAGVAPNIQEPLGKLSAAIWYDTYAVKPTDSYKQAQAKKATTAEAIKKAFESAPDDTAKHNLAEAYARLGHLYEIAGHIARENFFLEREQFTKDLTDGLTIAAKDRKLPLEAVTPGGIHQLLFAEKPGEANPFITMDVDQVVEKLSTPVTEYVFTQHPTNTNTLPSMRLQREIASEAEIVANALHRGEKNPDLSRLTASIQKFGEEPLVQEKNFTAKDETDICVNFLSNAYHDLDRLYEVSERALSRKFGESYNDEQRAKLDLKVRFGSWGSAGDKDGNNNIKSENTLEAIVMHKQKAAELLLASLREVGDLGVGDLPVHGLKEWQQGWIAKLEKASTEYQALINKIELYRNGNDIPLSNTEFVKFSEKAHDIAEELGSVKAFENDLKNAIKLTKGEQKNKLLAIDRKVRVFGFNLGKIEYRETAEEYERVVGALASRVRENEELGGAFKEWAKRYQGIYGRYKALSAKLKDPEETLTDLQKQDIERLTDSLKKTFGDEITRMLEDSELRADYIKHAHYVMERFKGETLRDLKTDDAIIYHSLRRMELARDFDDMITHNVLAEAQGVDSMMEALALQYAVTKDVVGKDGKIEKKRAKMHIVPLFEEAETMEKIPEVLKDSLENGVYHEHVKSLQEREGTKEITQQIQIAHSDNARRAGAIASRGIIHEGHVAASKAIEEYNKGKPANERIKLQFFEGGSLSDSYRNGVRAHTAMIEDFGMADFGKFTFQGGDVLNYFNQPTSMERVLLRGIVKQVEMKAGMHENGVDQTLEGKVRTGIRALQDQYDSDIYEAPGNPIGRLLYELGYRDHIAAGNAGTRGGARKTDPKEDENRAIDATAVRTIGFSETLQHEGIHPTFMGAGDIRAKIQDAIGGNPRDAAGWKKLYDESPSFKDVIDKLSYSIVNSDLRRPMEKIYYKPGRDPVLAGLMKDNAGWEDRHRALVDFVRDKLPKQYLEAAKLVYEAKTGKKFHDRVNPLHSEIHQLQVGEQPSPNKTPLIDAAERMKFVINNLDGMKHLEPLNYKRRFVEGVEVLESVLKKTVGSTVGYLARLFHNAVDTFTHGRTFMADDPTFRAAYMGDKQREQKFQMAP